MRWELVVTAIRISVSQAACLITPDNVGHVDIPGGVTSIATSAFQSCTTLVTISFPSSLQSIGNMAFQYSRLSAVDLSGTSLTSIGSYAFSTCSQLTVVSFPNSLTSIGNSACVYEHRSRALAHGTVLHD